MVQWKAHPIRCGVLMAVLTLLMTACGGHGSSPIPSGASSASGAAQSKHGATALSVLQKNSIAAPGRADQLIHGGARSVSKTTVKRATTGTSASYPVTADMGVTRPDESPCVVPLFTNEQFGAGGSIDYNNHLFQYQPPSPPCAGPWNKVVLELNLDVTAGSQYDRTGSLWIGGTNVWFGTTAEPSPNVAPSWHIERDVTDLAPIFTGASTGNVMIGNRTDCCGLTGVIQASAQLDFYPATAAFPAANVPDQVVSMANPPPGDNTYVGPYESPSLSVTQSFPRNIEKAYLDVYLQGQSSFDNYPLQGYDEFWYACLPNSLAQTMVNTYGLYQCEGTGFREGEVAVDGIPAGVAPIYPWVFTGGWDPFLWIPIPGVETLNFSPYRVDLTPFAGLLDNGSMHTVSITVFNDQDYFSGNAALLLYEDHGQSVDSGSLVSDTTQANPQETITDGTCFCGNVLKGPVTVSAVHNVYAEGVLDTSQGPVETQVRQSIGFTNSQQLNVEDDNGGLPWQQDITQATTVQSDTATTSNGRTQRLHVQQSWPFSVNYLFESGSNGGYTQITAIQQGKQDFTELTGGAGRPSWTRLSNAVSTGDTLNFDPYFNFLGNTGASSSQRYTYRDSSGTCWDKTITSANNVVSGSTGGTC
jgi:hypothetical protein